MARAFGARRAELQSRLRPFLWGHRRLYDGYRRGGQLARYALRRPHEPDFGAFAHFRDRHGLFLDVGANSGMSALSFRLVHPAPILSIEPNASHGPDLRFVRRLVRPMDFMLCAAGDRDGRLTLYVPEFRGVALTGEATLDRREILRSQSLRSALGERMEGPELTIRELDVPVRPLDALDLAPSFVKVDVQGTEAAVIRGLRATIERHRPVLMVEWGDQTEKVAAELEGLGYRQAFYDPAGERMTPTRTSSNVNVFFLPSPARITSP